VVAASTDAGPTPLGHAANLPAATRYVGGRAARGCNHLRRLKLDGYRTLLKLGEGSARLLSCGQLGCLQLDYVRSVCARSRSSAGRSNRGRSSWNSVHGALHSTMMCLSGRNPGSPSIKPAAISKVSVCGSGSGTMQPQVRQKMREYAGGSSLIGSSNFVMSFRPDTIRKPSRLMAIPAMYWDPEAFRHREQWHSSKGPTADSNSNRTPPHRHDP
jgi:hypothetical protein